MFRIVSSFTWPHPFPPGLDIDSPSIDAFQCPGRACTTFSIPCHRLGVVALLCSWCGTRALSLRARHHSFAALSLRPLRNARTGCGRTDAARAYEAGGYSNRVIKIIINQLLFFSAELIYYYILTSSIELSVRMHAQEEKKHAIAFRPDRSTLMPV